MKKKISNLMLLFICITLNAQEKNQNFNVGLKTQSGLIGFFGVEAEYIIKPDRKYVNSLLLNVSANAMKFDTDYGTVKGNGFELGLGIRNYLNKNSVLKGLYLDNYINYGAVKFDDKLPITDVTLNVTGEYKYISIINAAVGYKFMFKNFIVEPSISGRYNIEIKGKGLVDNKDVDNFLFNGNVRIGYSF